MNTYLKTGLITAVTITLLSSVAHARDGRDPGAMFDRMDADGDGQITQAEMDAQRSERFTSADANGDGFLSEEEIIAGMQQRAGSDQARDRVAQMIQRADTDGDGMLSAEEAGRGRQGGKFMEQIDANGDGVITRDEMENMRGRAGGKRQRPRQGN